LLVVAAVVALLVEVQVLMVAAMAATTRMAVLEPQTQAVVAVGVKTLHNLAAQAARASSSFATSLALLVLQPLLQQAARLLRRVDTQSTRLTPAARLKLSAVAERLNTLLLLAGAAVGLLAAAAAQAAIVLLSWVKALEVVRPLSPR
jgi:hypothetical protein